MSVAGTSTSTEQPPLGWTLTMKQARLVFRALRSSGAILTDAEEEQLARLRDGLMHRIEMADCRST